MRSRALLAVLVLALVMLAVIGLTRGWWAPRGDNLALPDAGIRAGSEPHAIGDAGAAASRTAAAASRHATATAAAPDAGAGGWVVRARTVQNGKPAPRVSVRARVFRGGKAEGQPLREELLASDAAGAFAWELTPPAEVLCLELQGVGERLRGHPETFVVSTGDPPPAPFDLAVYTLAGKVTGLVLDPEGKPIAGARVGRQWGDGATTDAAGAFTVAVPIRAKVPLDATAPGFVAARQDVVLDPEGAGTTTFRLRRGFRIRGRVTDADGQAVAGATVRTFHTIFQDAAQTGTDGRYELSNLDPSLKSHDLFARHPRFIEARVAVPTRGEVVEQDLVMKPGVGVTGVVVGPRGEAVAAATVFIGFSPSAYDRMDATSGADGRFAFACVAPGEQTLNVECRGLSSKRIKFTVPPAPAPAIELRVELEPGHFIGGLVTDAEGRPLPDVSVAPRLNEEYIEGIRARTDQAGRFRLDGVPATGLSLEFYARGVVRHDEKVGAVDRDDLVVRVRAAGRMAGTVVDGATGQPIARFRIRFGQPGLRAGEQQGSGYSASWLRGGHQFEDARGVFRVEDEVEVGSVFALEASAEGYAPVVDDHVVAVREPDPAQLVFRLHPGVAITGVVRGRESGEPIAGARVKAFASGRPLMPDEPNDDEGRPIAVSDASGAFRLENVGAGSLSIAVSHADWNTTTHGPIAVSAGVPVAPQEILLTRGARLDVRVLDAEGQPVARARVLCVSLAATGGHEQREATADADGRARFERVAPGDWDVVLVETQGARQLWAVRRFVRVGAQDRAVELRPRDGDATLSGTLQAEAPLPEGATVHVFAAGGVAPAEGAFRGRAVIASGGRFTIPHLPAQPLMLLASSLVDSQQWSGQADVTPAAGQVTAVVIRMKRIEQPRR